LEACSRFWQPAVSFVWYVIVYMLKVLPPFPRTGVWLKCHLSCKGCCNRCVPKRSDASILYILQILHLQTVRQIPSACQILMLGEIESITPSLCPNILWSWPCIARTLHTLFSPLTRLLCFVAMGFCLSKDGQWLMSVKA
jgi:hypothetical protein